MLRQFIAINRITATCLFTLGATSLAPFAAANIDATLAAQTPPVIQLAMMDHMSMGGMGSMPASNPANAKMNGGMPMNGPMPSNGSLDSMQDPMATPSSMDMMGRMRGSMSMQKSGTNMTPAGQLPGFPGASHLYHIGATDFFLDHPQHISLSVTQQTNLNRIKEKTLLDRASTERRIEEAEQELWVLTAADSPDASRIEAKVQAIEKLRSTERMAFIRAVGEAAKTLTSDQRASLLGTKPEKVSQPAVGSPMPDTPAPMPDKPMPDM